MAANRRIVVRRNTTTTAPDVIQNLEQLMDETAHKEVQAAKLLDEVAANKKKIFEQMQTSRIAKHETAFAQAAIIRKKGNAKNTVNVDLFRAKVSDIAFMQAVSVPMKSAEKYLGKKELAEVTDTVEGELKNPELEFKAKPGA